MSAAPRRQKRRSRLVILTVLVAAAIGIGSWAGAQDPAEKRDDPKQHDHEQADDGHKHDHDAGAAHVHAPVPAEYKSAHVPSAAWTDPRMIARGKQIYATRCAVCHGDTGDGKGPAGMALPLKPPDLRDQKMMREMAGNYWFWRISEGGAVEPFKSMGSAMPAWKTELPIEDRWAVIAYQHTFSGHDGPHVTSEHPQMMAGHDPDPTTGVPMTRPAASGGGGGAGHKH